VGNYFLEWSKNIFVDLLKIVIVPISQVLKLAKSVFKKPTRGMEADIGMHGLVLMCHDLSVFPLIRASMALLKACLKIGSNALPSG